MFFLFIILYFISFTNAGSRKKTYPFINKIFIGFLGKYRAVAPDLEINFIIAELKCITFFYFLNGAMLLNHIADTREDERCRKVAANIRTAYDSALEAGERTGDLGGKLGTDAFTDAVIRRLPA